MYSPGSRCEAVMTMYARPSSYSPSAALQPTRHVCKTLAASTDAVLTRCGCGVEDSGSVHAALVLRCGQLHMTSAAALRGRPATGAFQSASIPQLPSAAWQFKCGPPVQRLHVRVQHEVLQAVLGGGQGVPPAPAAAGVSIHGPLPRQLRLLGILHQPQRIRQAPHLGWTKDLVHASRPNCLH